MEIRTADIPDGKSVTPVGEVDMSTSVELRSLLLKLVRHKTRNITINLEEISYIDSSGLATLIECLQETEKYGGKMLLVVARKKILDVFKLARLDRVFTIAPPELKPQA